MGQKKMCEVFYLVRFEWLGIFSFLFLLDRDLVLSLMKHNDKAWECESILMSPNLMFCSSFQHLLLFTMPPMVTSGKITKTGYRETHVERNGMESLVNHLTSLRCSSFFNISDET